jgi:hypothetical protein
MTEDDLIREALRAPCNMRHQPPMDFAYCETHDETFPLGGICSVYRGNLTYKAIASRARGDWAAEREALDALALDDRARNKPWTGSVG